MRTITITGEDRHIENIVKESRGRMDRGYITISECTEVKAKESEKKVVNKPAKAKVPKSAKKVVVIPDTKQAPKPDTKDVNPESR